MPTKRRLEDLYVLGKEETFDDGTGDPITVWLQKLNPIDTSTALRRAAAARARVQAVRTEPDSDEYMALRLEMSEIKDALTYITYLMGEPEMRITERSEAMLAAEEEWAKDGYLTGLKDLWQESLQTVYAVTPEDPDARRVFAELQRFNDAATLLAEEELAVIRDELEAETDEDLETKVFDRLISYHGNSAWLDEFRRVELWLGVREGDDHKKRYFTQRDEVDVLSGEVLGRLLGSFQLLTVDVTEGKGSEETPSSSDSSVPPAKAETGVSSGLVAVGP